MFKSKKNVIKDFYCVIDTVFLSFLKRETERTVNIYFVPHRHKARTWVMPQGQFLK